MSKKSERSTYTKDEWHDLAFDEKVIVLKRDFESGFRLAVMNDNGMFKTEIYLIDVEDLEVEQSCGANVIESVEEIKKALNDPKNETYPLVKAVFDITTP